jgi:hypothetical protein
MKNTLLSILVVVSLVAAGTGGTLAGFVDTEVSPGNFIQAGISDLLVNGANDPNVGAKIQFDHASPSKSIDFWADLYNWGKCQGGDVYMMFKDVVSEEAGTKLHNNVNYVYDGTSPGSNFPMGAPFGYRAAVGNEPKGPNVWSSEPEKIAEVGGGFIAQYEVTATNPNLKGEDYASGVSQHLDVSMEVPYIGATGTILGNPDTNGDGVVSDEEHAAWITAGNRWVEIVFPLPAGTPPKLANIAGMKVFLGFLRTQTMTFVHIDVVIQQIEDVAWTAGGAGIDYDGDGDIDAADMQLKWWPTNALQGDIASWAMMFELTTDP